MVNQTLHYRNPPMIPPQIRPIQPLYRILTALRSETLPIYLPAIYLLTLLCQSFPILVAVLLRHCRSESDMYLFLRFLQGQNVEAPSVSLPGGLAARLSMPARKKWFWPRLIPWW